MIKSTDRHATGKRYVVPPGLKAQLQKNTRPAPFSGFRNPVCGFGLQLIWLSMEFEQT
ncbi:MAG: hypothetical protein R3C17_08260 [Planctomycetaceae bacterium]